jgi:hypothetical protein
LLGGLFFFRLCTPPLARTVQKSSRFQTTRPYREDLFVESKTLAEIQSQLQKEREGYNIKAEKLRAELVGFEENLKRIDAAIAALSGAARSKGEAASPRTRTRKPSSLPAASKADVAKLVVAALENGEPVSVDTLKASVEEQLVASGFSRMGFSLRLNEVLKEERFVEAEGGVRLRKDGKVTSKG